MPELPEVETVRRDLAATIGGHRIAGVEVSGRRTVRRQPVPELVERLSGTSVSGVRRASKYLVVDLDSGDALVVHLRMSGQLRWHQATDALAAHTHAVLKFAHGEVRFVDPRTFGEWFVVAGDQLPFRLGQDPLNDGLTGPGLAAVMAHRRRPLKVALLDQQLVAGIGNIYADEICHQAGIRTDRRTDSLSARQWTRLASAAGTVLTAAVAARGSTLGDAQYVDLFGQPGLYQHEHRVYARQGLPCLRCQTPVQRAVVGQRSTFFCAHCQS
ncbi:MAG: DNA-(apurinic or apyrimidinic site) lyase [Acidimicrobiia bacterium]|nr:DNA-(apurinic or apyrimidinic site) lyase [Acidimicrobiia bacterium]